MECAVLTLHVEWTLLVEYILAHFEKKQNYFHANNQVFLQLNVFVLLKELNFMGDFNFLSS